MDEDNIEQMGMEKLSTLVVLLRPVLNSLATNEKSEFVESCFSPIRCKFVATR